MAKFYTAATIERLATELLARYYQRINAPLAPPISAEHVLDVALADELGSLLWDTLPEPPGCCRLGSLDQTNRVIVLNEHRRELLLGTPGLLNTTIAHEIAHWVLHVDRARLNHPVLPGFESVTISEDERVLDHWDERNAHRFMGCLLMPRELIVPLAQTADLSHWAGLYRLRDQFDVTITAVKIRLEHLGFTYVDESGNFYDSRAAAVGQQSFT